MHTVSRAERGEGSVCQHHLNTKTSKMCGWQRNKNRLLLVLFSCFKTIRYCHYLYPHCSRIKGIQLRTDILLSCPRVTKIPVFVYFRYSHAMESATPLILAKMDDPSWWQWRVGWAMAWSWCWISSRMNTCLYGERLVSLPGGKPSAKTTWLCVYLCHFFLINLTPK